MHTVKSLAKAHGKSLRTVQRWVEKAREQYPDMGWELCRPNKNSPFVFSVEQAEKILEFAPKQPEFIPQADRVELIDGEVVDVEVKATSGLALNSPTVTPGMGFTHQDLGLDERDQALTLGTLNTLEANKTLTNFAEAMLIRSVSNIARDVAVMEANAKAAAQKRLAEKTQEYVG